MTNNPNVVCFGEVLFDILPGGPMPGGAPMNVAYHLKKLNENPALITRIGNDKNGEELQNFFWLNDISRDYIQVDEKYETGIVYAKPGADNEMSYDIVQPVAWDFIGWGEPLETLVQNADFFVFGSLAARNEVSRNTLFKLLEAANTKVLDINLREPHYSLGLVQELLHKADILKMNDAELELITGWYADYNNVADRMKFISEKFNIVNIVVTMGSAGAMFKAANQILHHPGFKVNVADTVGSGDAFLAGFLSQLIEVQTDRATLEFACAMGAFMASKTGACPEYDLLELHAFLK